MSTKLILKLNFSCFYILKYKYFHCISYFLNTCFLQSRYRYIAINQDNSHEFIKSSTQALKRRRGFLPFFFLFMIFFPFIRH